MRRAFRWLLAAVLVLMTGWVREVSAQVKSPAPDLGRATLEDLMNIEITAASRKEQRAQDVPAAVYVLTADEIRRSGIQTLPELLRLVPGVQVARINANRWAISVRGGLSSRPLAPFGTWLRTSAHGRRSPRRSARRR